MDVLLPEDFCYQLEHALTNALKHADNEDTKGYWCDGVSPNGVSMEDTIVSKAWIGKDGQDEYILTIHLEQQNRNLMSLAQHIPEYDTKDWWKIDRLKLSVDVYL